MQTACHYCFKLMGKCFLCVHRRRDELTARTTTTVAGAATERCLYKYKELKMVSQIPEM